MSDFEFLPPPDPYDLTQAREDIARAVREARELDRQRETFIEVVGDIVYGRKQVASAIRKRLLEDIDAELARRGVKP